MLGVSIDAHRRRREPLCHLQNFGLRGWRTPEDQVPVAAIKLDAHVPRDRQQPPPGLDSLYLLPEDLVLPGPAELWIRESSEQPTERDLDALAINPESAERP